MSAVADLATIWTGRYSVRYRCHPEREQLRQAVYRWARKQGVHVCVLTDGRGSGTLRAIVEISGRCLERRAAPRRREPSTAEYAQASRSAERFDRMCAAQLHAIVRRGIADHAQRERAS